MRRRSLVWAVSGLLTTTGYVGAQTDDYYIFSDGPDDAWVVRGGAVQLTFDHQVDDVAIAVADTIRALQFDGNGSGLEYTLEGVPTGNSYPFPPGVDDQLLDGTTDGVQYNYAGEWQQGDVYRMDRSWADPEFLFNAGRGVVGITYDGATDTLWISLDETMIINFDFAGNMLSMFSPGSGRWGSLAWEPSTDTLWAINRQDSVMQQWDKAGNLLNSQFVADFGNVWGGEFAIPAPGALPMLAGAALLVPRRRRRTG